MPQRALSGQTMAKIWSKMSKLLFKVSFGFLKSFVLIFLMKYIEGQASQGFILDYLHSFVIMLRLPTSKRLLDFFPDFQLGQLITLQPIIC